jgi:hypothetical protein
MSLRGVVDDVRTEIANCYPLPYVPDLSVLFNEDGSFKAPEVPEKEMIQLSLFDLLEGSNRGSP